MRDIGECLMNYKYNVSIILVNYNGRRYIDTLFESLCNLKHSDFSYEVVFVDNASDDDSVGYLISCHYEERLNLHIVENKENLGFAGGNNVGVQVCNGEYIAFLNNDTKVTESWLQNLYHFMINHSDAVMVNSKLLFFYDFLSINFETKDNIFMEKEVYINGDKYLIDNKFCTNMLYEENHLVCFGHTEIHLPLLEGEKDYEFIFKLKQPLKKDEAISMGSSKVSKEGLTEVKILVSVKKVKQEKYPLVQNAGSGINETFDGYDIGFCKKDCEEFRRPYEINNGCGASILMKREDFIKSGMFDKRFFMYYEDTDLSYRIKKVTGGKIWFCPNSVVRHIHTGSSTEWSPFFTYQVYRNKLLFIFKNISKREFFKYYKIHKKQGIAENNPYKIRGTKDVIKIILGFRNVSF